MPGYKFPCYYVHIRYPIRVQDKKWPHRVIGTKEGVVKPKGHTYCRTVQEAYSLAYGIAEKMDGERQVEIRAKMRGRISLVTIIRGRNGPHARKGMAKLEDVVNAGV